MAQLLIISVALLVTGLAGFRAQDTFGPATDRVGLPKYAADYQVLRTFTAQQDTRVLTVYANDKAASMTDLAKLPYPYGSIIVVEYRHAVKDAAGAPLRDAQGQLGGGEIFRIDVMRREKGFGEAYRGERTGEWEYASYRPDGGYLTAPERSSSCATCHVKAGVARDFVYRGRFPALPGQ